MKPNIYRYLFFLLPCFVHQLYGQQGNLLSGESDTIVAIDTSTLLYEEDFYLDDQSIIVGGEPAKHIRHMTISEGSDEYPRDTVRRVNPLDSVGNMKVRALMMDSLYWKAIDTNFVIFDSMTVNPYEVDAVKYKDTLAIILHDSIASDSARWWSMPLSKNERTSKFGPRWSRWHYGTDLRLKIGDTVRATFDGVVRIAKYNRGGYGWYVLLRHHNGLETLYGHHIKNLVGVGDTVKAGQVVGLGGNTGRSTGPHLHFEVRYQGNAINAEELFDFTNDTLRSGVFVLTPKSFDYIREMRRKKYHRIRSGDTLYGLARRYRVSVGQICRLNRIRRTTILRVGRTLRVK